MDARNTYRREINKYIEQNCVPSWIYLRDYTAMHGQQNIKLSISLAQYVVQSLVELRYTDSTVVLYVVLIRFPFSTLLWLSFVVDDGVVDVLKRMIRAVFFRTLEWL